MSEFALLAHVTEQIHPNPQVAMERLKVTFDRKGPYETARMYGALRNGSGADFAVEFMTIANKMGLGPY